MIYSYLISK